MTDSPSSSMDLRLSALRNSLGSGVISARQLLEHCLDRATDPSGEGDRAFLSIAADRARAVADGVDAARKTGAPLPPYAGIPVAVKDLCDIEGEVTTAGSKILADRAPAAATATSAARLLAAGFNVIGRTNMTEFAYSGLGLNVHYDTPRAPWERPVGGRIPGGSSSGSAVAVADGMVAGALGTDTGGSCRIPAAFCGIVGYKPTARRVPLEGIFPLSRSLDSVGPLANSVDCCAAMDSVFAGNTTAVDKSLGVARPAGRIRLALITNFVLDNLDQDVAVATESALSKLGAAGVEITEITFPELHRIGSLSPNGGLAAAEAYHWHRELLATSADGYDQRIRTRIEPGSKTTASEYIDILDGRRQLIEAAARHLAGFDAFILPTVAVTPPTVSSFDDGDADYYSSQNMLCLRNTAVGNMLDSCAISLPAVSDSGAPAGIMLMGPPMGDADLFSVARTVEAILATT